MKKHIGYILILSLMLFAAIYIINNTHYGSYEKRISAGDRYLSQKEYAMAEKAYKRAVELSETEYDPYAGLACVYQYYKLQSKYDEMRAALRKCGLDENAVERVLSAYGQLPASDAVDIKIEDTSHFNFYDENGFMVMSKEDRSKGSYEDYTINCYNYDENKRLVSEDVTINRYGGLRCERLEHTYNTDGSLSRTLKMDSRISDKKVPVYEEVYFYNSDGTLERMENSRYNKYIEKWWINFVNWYEDNNLIQQDCYKLNGYPETDLIYTEYYGDNGKPEKRVNYHSDGEIKNYHLYTYLPDQITVDEEYNLDDTVNQRITTTAHEDGVTTITQLYNRDGQVVKTTTTEADGTETVERIYDNIINPRPLTDEEIRQVNEYKYILGAFTSGANGFWYRNKFEYPEDVGTSFLCHFVRDSWLTIYDEGEVSNLLAEGIDINYDSMEFWGTRYHKVSYSRAQQLLDKYLGLSCENLGNELWDTYSGRYNSFYISKSGDYYTKPAFECIGGVAGDNMVKLYSRSTTLYLKPTDDGYLILAHTEEDHSALIPPEPEYEMRMREVFIETDSSKGVLYNNAMKAYNDFLDKNLPEEYPGDEDMHGYAYIEKYALYDITRDGLPELFTFVNSGGFHKDVYTYKNGEVLQLPDSFGNSYHGPDKVLKCGMTANEHTSTGITYFFTIYYPDGSTKQVSFATGGSYDESKNYFVEGEFVTKEEYIAYAKEYMYAWNSEEVELEYITVYEKVYK